MRNYLKGAAMALALAGATLVTAGAANADDHYGRDQGNSTVSIGFGNIAFGYRDGYWDSGHHWHHWNNTGEYRNYRHQNGSHYYNRSHTHYDNNGWQN